MNLVPSFLFHFTLSLYKVLYTLRSQSVEVQYFLEKESETRIQILDEAVCILHCTTTLIIGMYPIINLPVMGKKLSRHGS